MKPWLRALHFFRPDASRLGGVLALMLGGAVANLLKPWPLAWIVDGVLGHQPLPAPLHEWWRDAAPAAQLAWLGLLVFALHLLAGALAAGQNFLSIQIGLRGLTRVRVEVFGALQRLSLRVHQGTQTGDLIHRAAWDTYAFQTFFQQGLVNPCGALLGLGLMVTLMARLNGPLTLAALGTIPLLVATMKFFGRRMSERGQSAQAADARVTALVQQSLALLPLTQSYTREAQEQQRFDAQAGTAQQQRQAQHGWEVLYGLGVTTAFALGAAALAWLGARQVLAGELSLGGLLVFLAYLAQLYEPLNQLSHVGSSLAGAGAGVRRVFELLDTPEEVRDAPGARPVRSRTQRVTSSNESAPADALVVAGELRFENVSFAYDAAQPVLRDVTFTLAAGRTAAIIGPSGVGKTTLLHLLTRAFDPAAGVVRLDGADVRDLRLKELRAQVALVGQEPLLLPATIAENIACGRPAASRAEIAAAAQAAHAEAFIRRLPQGYDTPVGEGAARLSVGEAQRLSLARAFLKDAPILLLDEPTSALDAESEAGVVAGLRALRRGRTVLVVAHRLSTIQDVDEILVLQDGRLTEHGSPDELRRRGGYFARVAAGQVPLE